jgi:NAD(P)H-dependent FMN reductase
VNTSIAKILLISGTSREGAMSNFATEFIASIGRNIKNVEINIINPTMFNLPGDGNNQEDKDPEYTKLVSEADGYFIVTPEYNHSYPGSLKRMLDSEYQEYFHKPVVLAGVSSGVFGGARAVQALLGPLRKMGMIVLGTDVYFQNSFEIFDEQGSLIAEKHELYTKAVNKSFDELIWMIGLLNNNLIVEDK